jgi:hypothetical protein
LDNIEHETKDEDMLLHGMGVSGQVPTKEDSVDESQEGSEWKAEQGAKDEPKMETEEDGSEQESNTEHPYSQESLKLNDKEAGMNEQEPQQVDEPRNSVDATTITKRQLNKDNPLASKHLKSAVASGISKLPRMSFHKNNVENNSKIQTDGGLSIDSQIKQSPTQPAQSAAEATNFTNAPLTGISSAFIDPIEPTHFLPKWFGPCYSHYSYRSLWENLQGPLMPRRGESPPKQPDVVVFSIHSLRNRMYTIAWIHESCLHERIRPVKINISGPPLPSTLGSFTNTSDICFFVHMLTMLVFWRFNLILILYKDNSWNFKFAFTNYLRLSTILSKRHRQYGSTRKGANTLYLRQDSRKTDGFPDFRPFQRE